MRKSVEAPAHLSNTIRTGPCQPSMLDKLSVILRRRNTFAFPGYTFDPDSQTIQIQRSIVVSMALIEKAIAMSDLRAHAQQRTARSSGSTFRL